MAEQDFADQLAQVGFCVASDFLPAAQISALAQDARALHARFRPAGTGARHARDQQLRGDATLWLEPPGANAPQRNVLARFEALRLALNRELQLGLFDFECHYALYPPGAFYRRHLDRLRDDDARVLSCVLYLNRDWQRVDGGELRLHLPESAPLDVLPAGGTLIAFLSERFEHEVLPARRERLSLTGWFRRRAG